jgi:hypothetical protein
MRIQFINSLKPISEAALKFLCFLASSPPDDLNQFLELTQERGVARVEAICINLSSLLLRICEHSCLPLGEADSVIFTHYVRCWDILPRGVGGWRDFGSTWVVMEIRKKDEVLKRQTPN